MAYVIEARFDPSADGRVRDVWARLDAVGIKSPGSRTHRENHPHISLLVFDEMETRLLGELAGPAGEACGVDVELSATGFFDNRRCIAFLSVRPALSLVAAQSTVVESARPLVSRIEPHFELDAWIPHCTLAYRVTDLEAFRSATAGFDLPITATLDSVHLVEVGTGRPITRFDDSQGPA